MTRGYQILFRVDAGPEQGLGHLRRCLALAEAFRREGLKRIGFLTRNTRWVHAWTGRQFKVERIRGKALEEEVRDCGRLFQEASPELLILDHYQYTPKAVGFLKRVFKRIAYMDDFDRGGRYPVNAVVNQNVFASRLSYPVRSELKLFLGSQYTLIPKDILAKKDQKKSETPLKLFISLGGSASMKSLEKILEAFVLVRRKIRDAQAFLMKGIMLNHRNIHLPAGIQLVSSNKAAPTMGNCNLAISAGGVTSYELACLGVPSVLIVTAENERRRAEELERAGAALEVGWIGTVTPTGLAAFVLGLWEDRMKRKRMRECGRKLIDGHGAARLAKDLKRAFLK